MKELQRLKEQGNTLFRQGDLTAALKTYTAAINQARAAGLYNARHHWRPGLPQAGLLGTIYSNRAAVALKLERYEQAVWDCTMAAQLLGVQLAEDVHQPPPPADADPVVGKTLLRAAKAYEMVCAITARPCCLPGALVRTS
ncbi:hypothetical protein WJX72_004971 [[Myrmecia] bisecta]|uniref:Uncharacterized protein n=1 Tax=[Myrmecia] bisecta TaxID=41462 RepID=A0AAW1Q441_9CHLO